MAIDLLLIPMMLLAAALGALISFALLSHWQVTSRERLGRAMMQDFYHERK